MSWMAASAADADEMTGTKDYAAIILDWLLPGKDGMTLCRELRALGVPTPILMLTARRGPQLDDVRAIGTKFQRVFECPVRVEIRAAVGE